MGNHTHPTATAEGRESEPALRKLLAAADKLDLEEFILFLAQHDRLHTSFGSWYEWVTPKAFVTLWEEWDEQSY